MVSSEAKIKTFTFSIGSPAELIAGVVTNSGTEATGTIEATVPYGTVVTAIAPTITVSDGASVAPVSGASQDFTSDVTYVVTAEDGTTTRTYTATITVADAPSPAPVVTPSTNLGVKPRVPGWAGTRLFTGTIGTYAEGGIDLGLGLFVPRFAISVLIDGPYTGFFDVATKKLKVYGSSGEASGNLSTVKYSVILMGM